MQNQGNTKVFISYSRKDKAFVQKLNDALNASGIAPWVDWEGIPLSSDWMAEITTAIQSADAFLFVISPESLKSRICMDEVELGIKFNKKIIPILYKEPLKGHKIHPRLASTHWVYLRSRKDDFKVTIPKLVEAIQTDLSWVQQHTRLLQRALEWERKNHSKHYLLQETDLLDGEHWITESTKVSSREVIPIQAEYINVSRREAIQRQRNLTMGIAAALVFSMLLVVFAFIQSGRAVESEKKAKNSQATAEANGYVAATQKAIAEEQKIIAEENAKRAKALRSASEARIYQGQSGELNTSTLLAINAYQQIPDLAEAEDVLRHNLSLLAVPIKSMNVNARIRTIQFNPDRTKFASVDSAGYACIWSADDGTKYFCAKHDGIVLDSVFSEDGNILVTGTEKGVVTFWNVGTGKFIKSLQFPGSIFDLNLHPNGFWLGVGASNAIYIIDMADMEQKVYFSQQGDVSTIDFDSSGLYMGAGTSEGYISIWLVSETNITTVSRHDGAVLDIAFSNDSKYLISGGTDSTARATVTVNGGEAYLVKHGDWVEDVTFGPDGSWYATASDDNFVRILDTETGQERLRLAHTNFVTKVRISRDGQWIATTGYDDTVRIWDVVTGALVMEIPIKTTGADIRFNRDITRLIVGDQDGNITLWDISQLKTRTGYISFSDYLQESKFSPDGKWMVINSYGGDIWSIKSGELGQEDANREKLTTSNDFTTNMAISPDSKWIAAIEYDSFGDNPDHNRVILLNAETKKESFLSHDGELIDAIVFTPDSKQIITADEKGLVKAWNVESNEKAYQLETNNVILSLAISPNGKYLVAGIEEGNFSIVWDVNTKKQIATLDQIGKINSVQFSSNGKFIATGSSEGSIYLWNTSDFTRLNTDFHVNGELLSLAFSPDDKFLAIGDSTGFAYLFDIKLGQEVSRLPHIDKVTSVSFSPNGKQLATVSRKAVMLWDVPSIPIFTREKLAEIACSRMTENFDQNKWKLIFFEDAYYPICPKLPAGGD